MLKKNRCLQGAVAFMQAAALLAIGTAAQASSVGTPPGGNREPINFVAGSPFSHSTWTPAHNAHIPGIANGIGLAKHGMGLDLTSTNDSISIGHGLIHGHNTVTIRFDDLSGGGDIVTHETFRANQSVTPAEFVAILEVLANRGRGTQTLELDPSGIAEGGTFSLNHLISPRITTLVIPQNVTAQDNIRLNPLMGMMGPMVNDGTIDFFSTSNRIHTGLFYSSDRAGNVGGGTITNGTTGLISTTGINLVLAADNTITNNGTILGGGDLKFATAYGAITNGTTGLINGQRDVILLPGANPQSPPLLATVNNYGTINSTAGNIRIDSPVKNADIILNGTTTVSSTIFTGTMEAFSGYVNVRESAYNGSGNTLINGGSYQGDNGGFNIFSGTGSIIANAGNSTFNAESVTNAFQSPLFSFTTTGNVDVQDSSANGIRIAPSTGGAVNIGTGGSTTLTALSSTSGDLTVLADSGVLRTVPFAQISSAGGLKLQNLDGTNGQVIIGTGSSLTAANGNVIVAADSSAVITAAAGTAPSSNVSVGGTGSVFWGQFGISVLPPTNTVVTNGFGTIIFDEASNSNQIQLQGGVNISSSIPVAYTGSVSRSDEMIVDSGLDAE
ncbi:MAG TPA: hypothetical protein V6D22_11080 [Candidatus Obscuribacterales bacterium]